MWPQLTYVPRPPKEHHSHHSCHEGEAPVHQNKFRQKWFRGFGAMPCLFVHLALRLGLYKKYGLTIGVTYQHQLINYVNLANDKL